MKTSGENANVNEPLVAVYAIQITVSLIAAASAIASAAIACGAVCCRQCCHLSI